MASYKPRFAVSPEHVFDELRKGLLVDGFDHVVDMEKSHGSRFVEGRTGKEYLDLFSCIASMPIGMNHPKMVDPAFVEYLGKAALNKPSNSDIYCVEQATFVKTFFQLAVPQHFTYSFFIDGGALAVENALKAAMDWKVRKNKAKGWKTERGHKVLHFEGAFHGRSGYTLSLTNTDPRKTDLFPKFDWPRVSAPARRFPATDESLALTIVDELRTIDQIKAAFHNEPDDICAIIIEPIQGEGGDVHFRGEFLQQLRVLADENDALLIFDEVQTGVGITGRWWAHEALDVVPDIMSFGKKMQVCGILAGPRLDDVPDNVFHTSSRINSTWGGSLVDMVRSTKYLEIIDEENLLKNAEVTGAYLDAKVQDLASRIGSDVVSNVRGLGLFRAFDLPTREMRNATLANLFKNGVLIVGSGLRSIRFRPALNLTPDLVDEGMEILERSIKEAL
jgi:L-lysine 6-transaminase